MRKLALAAAFAVAALPALAAEAVKLKDVEWHHAGPFGTFDRAAAQRGFLVYKEVCAACHSLRYVAFRHLEDIGLTEAETKALAATYQVVDGPDDSGEMFERAGKPSDRYPSPYPNEKAARAANNGAYPPDLSLITKARVGFENYVYSVLTGYEEPPAGVEVREGMSYNAYFPGHQIAMPQPINDDQVTYPDGTKASIDQMAHDVVTFLAWAAEPSLEARKKMGVKVLLFLLAFAIVLYAVKRKVWAAAH
jgi:ubiquinol-cytochrome c reductase cytochrome c1 subunit